MPTSRSRKPSANLALIALIALATVAAVIVAALPASMAKRWLPDGIDAGDFSGTIWHGSAGHIAAGGRNLGAIEWRLHPLALVHRVVAADLHWVRVGFVADGAVEIGRHAVTAHAVQGNGPIEDLADIGLAPGWRGVSTFNFSELAVSFDDAVALVAAVGDVAVADLTTPQIADGANLGGYDLHLADGAITPDADAAAELSDTGGPLDLKATIHFSVKQHTGILSGTIGARPEAPPALRAQIDNLAQLHPRNAQGRIPVELEFTF